MIPDETSQPVEQEPSHSSTPFTEEAAADGPPNPEQGAEGSDDSEEKAEQPPSEKPRIRLRPTVDDGQFKAVASLGPSQSESSNAAPPAAKQETAPTGEESTPAGLAGRQAASEADSVGGVESPGASESSVEASPQGVVESAGQPTDMTSGPQSADSEPVRQKPSRHAAAGPVDLPPEVDHLDEQLEAEIEAALSDGALDPALHNVAEEDEAAKTESPNVEDLESGAHLTGRIQTIHGDNVFLDVGLRSPAVVPKRQFEKGKKPVVGQLIEVVVDRFDREDELINCNLPKGVRKTTGGWESLEVGQIIDCIVTKTNKGGLEVTVGGIRGFLPASQVDFSFVSDLEPYVGQKLAVKTLEVNAKKRNLVVSRRGFLEIERKEAEQALWDSIEDGQTLPGTIKTIKNYGAFVDLGGVDGFLHIGEISWGRIKHPSEVVQVGQQVQVKVLGVDREKRKVSLGMRQLTADPWMDAAEKYAIGSNVCGKVTRTTQFGAFVMLEPGIEGLVHISELDHKRVNRVTDVVKVDQEINAQVLEVDPVRKRVGLSVKALVKKPDEAQAEAADKADSPSTPRKRRGPLKGGTGESTGGGLFGNPKDFG